MAKQPTVNRNTDFRRMYWRAKSAAAPALVCYAMKNRLGVTRYGITTGKKIGKAVQRNRARRVIREAYRSLLPEIGAGWDLVFVARTRTVFSKTPAVEQAMRKNLTALGVLAPRKSQ